tara:strand:+ start:632 stop:1033 length:402 start_codon:yes stop_codon:yes gene_type:complete
MKRNELKKILKPLIKECIKEVLFEEDGALSHIIKEVAIGISDKQTITESVSYQAPPPKRDLNQHKKKLLDAIGKDAYNGINLFEGTTPAPAPISNGATQGPLSGVASNDPGVNISNLFSNKSSAIFKKMMEKK